MKKLTAFIITVSLIVSTFAILAVDVSAEMQYGANSGVGGASGTPSGTAVSSASEITNASGTYYLTSDITVSAPIFESFTGTLDGNGFTITASAPLFKNLSGTVKNVKIVSTITCPSALPSDSFVQSADGDGSICYASGAIACTASGFTVSNTLASVTLKNDSYTDTTNKVALGGLVGKITDGMNHVIDCRVTGSISSTQTNTFGGGLAALNGNSGSTYVSYFTNSASVTVAMNSAGVIGDNRASVTLTYSLNEGKVTTVKGNNHGGFIGYNNKSCTFIDCKNTGEVAVGASDTSASGMGGFIGKCDASTTFTRCLNAGKVTSRAGDDGAAGGIIGGYRARANMTLTDCENTGAITNTGTNQNHAGGMIGAIFYKDLTKTTAFTVTFSGCSNSGTVKTSGNGAGGLLGSMMLIGGSVSFTDCSNSGTISANNAAGGIFGLSRCAVNISVSGCENTGAVTASASRAAGMIGEIGSYSVDGANRQSFKSLTINSSVNNGSISTTSSDNAGGMVGYIDPQITDNTGSLTMLLESCTNNGSISAATGKASGMIGYSNVNTSSTISSASLTIRNCVNNGTCTGKEKNGSIIGTFNFNTAKQFDVTVENCINNGTVKSVGSSAVYTAGFFGYCPAANCTGTWTVRNCVNAGDVALENCDGRYANFFGLNSYQNLEIINCAGLGRMTCTPNGEKIATYYALAGTADNLIVTNCCSNSSAGPIGGAPVNAPVCTRIGNPYEAVSGGYITGYVFASDGSAHFGSQNMIVDATLQLDEGFTLRFSASAADAKLRITQGTGTPVVLDGKYDARLGLTVFTFNGISPEKMGDTIKAELLVNGSVVDTKNDYSVRTYCLNVLKMNENNAVVKTLIADILEYGAEAQLYTGYNTSALVNAGVTGKSAASAPSGSDKVVYASSDTVYNTGIEEIGLSFEDTIRFYIVISTDAPRKQIALKTMRKTQYETVSYDHVVDLGNGHYKIYSEPVKAAEFSDVFDLRVVVAGEVVQQALYSVNSYVYAMRNDSTIGRLVKALYNYGRDAEAYRGY